MKTTGTRSEECKRARRNRTKESGRERGKANEREARKVSRVSACEHRKSVVQRPRDQRRRRRIREGERRRKDEKWFREHVRRCSCGGRPVVPGINTAFNVGRRRSWTRSPQGASLLVAPGARLPRRASSRLSLPVIAPDPTPRPPPTEGSLLFLRSAIRR